MADVIFNSGTATVGAYPPKAVQFGNQRGLVVKGDMRPLSLVFGGSDGRVRAYPAGIKAPVYYPQIAASSENAKRLVESIPTDTSIVISVVYAYYSSVRGCFSQISPPTRVVWANASTTVKKLEISGFLNPRDDAAANDIDTVVVGVQLGTATGYMCLWGDMTLKPTGDWSTGTTNKLVFDFSEADLEQGFDLNLMNSYAYVPPAVEFVARHGERVWFGGQRKGVTFSGTSFKIRRSGLSGTIAVTNGSAALAGTGTAFDTELIVGDLIYLDTGDTTQTNVGTIATISDLDTATLSANFTGAAGSFYAYRPWRGLKVAQLLVADGPGVLNDSHLYMGVYANGRYVGDILDVVDSKTAYLSVDVDASISETIDLRLAGYNDRIWPSAYYQETPGGVPTANPEMLQFGDSQMLSEGLDQGQRLMGMESGQDRLSIVYDNALVTMVGGSEVGIPAPQFVRSHGKIGASSSRSICIDRDGGVWWMGEDGPCRANTSAVDVVSSTMGIREFWRGWDIWQDKTKIKDIVMVYSRQWNAIILGNMKVGRQGVDAQEPEWSRNYWAVLSLEPQLGFWLMNRIHMTSNIAEYKDSDGNSQLVVGDAYNGRVKRLLDTAVLTDVDNTSASTAAFTCLWREGYLADEQGDPFSPARIRMNRLLVPGDTAGSITLLLWKSPWPVRDDQDLPSAGTYTTTVSTDNVKGLRDVALANNCDYFHSIGVQWSSTSGADDDRPMEIAGWLMFDQRERR